MKQERLAKAAHKGPQAEAIQTAPLGGPVSDATPVGSASSTSKVSTHKNRNYAVLAGTITVFNAIGWYLKGSKKKPEEGHD